MLIGPWFEHITERIGLVSRVVCSKLRMISHIRCYQVPATDGRSVLFHVLRQMMGNCTTKKKKKPGTKTDDDCAFFGRLNQPSYLVIGRCVAILMRNKKSILDNEEEAAVLPWPCASHKTQRVRSLGVALRCPIEDVSARQMNQSQKTRRCKVPVHQRD